MRYCRDIKGLKNKSFKTPPKEFRMQSIFCYSIINKSNTILHLLYLKLRLILLCTYNHAFSKNNIPFLSEMFHSKLRKASHELLTFNKAISERFHRINQPKCYPHQKNTRRVKKKEA